MWILLRKTIWTRKLTCKFRHILRALWKVLGLIPPPVTTRIRVPDIRRRKVSRVYLLAREGNCAHPSPWTKNIQVLHDFTNNTSGHAWVPMSNPRSPITEAQVRSQTSPCGICGGRRFIRSSLIPFFSVVMTPSRINSLIHLLPTMYNTILPGLA